MMAIGATFAGSAMASEYSESTSQRIAEANRAAAEPHVAGVFANEPAISDADTLNAMVQTSESRSASNDVPDVSVRQNGQGNPDRTFQGWWKD